MPDNEFCRYCGTALKPNSEVCPKCGKVVTTVLPAGTSQFETSQPATQPASTNKIWGIDKRFFIIALVFLILIVPVFPRDKTIYVDGQTVTTQVYQSTSMSTLTQTVTTNTQSSISVYSGTITTIPNTYYSYYNSYYNNCYYRIGRIVCNYNSWPYYNSYMQTTTIQPSQHIVSISQSPGSNNLETLTLTSYEGTVQTISNVVDTSQLTQTGTATVSATSVITNTVVNTVVNPATTVNNVPCQSCVTQKVTERVSILQLLFGF
ncbi:MAG: zinc ribbon domain-containing protein [Candidatus Bathyarchaeia archaeon]